MTEGAANPTISVVIPTYNRAAMVTLAIESALAQTHPPTEVIVVDDGSSDGTRKILHERFGNKIVFIEQANQGVAVARNTGIRRARGEWIAFLDSDECWHRRKLEVQTNWLRQHPDANMLAGGVGKLHSPDVCTADLPATAGTQCDRVPLSDLVISACFQTSTVMVRRSSLEEVGLFDAGLRSSEDRDLWIRLGARFDVWKMETNLTFTRIEERDHLSGRPTSTEKNLQLMIDKVFRQLPELRGQRSLRRKALSVAAHEAGLLYTEHGDHAKAIRLMMRSLCLWPLPRKGSSGSRVKTLAVLGLRLTKIRKEFQKK